MSNLDKLKEIRTFINRVANRKNITDIGLLILNEYIDDIQQKLEILEFLKEEVYFSLEEFDNGYFLQVGGNSYIKLTKEQYDLFKERLNNNKIKDYF